MEQTIPEKTQHLEIDVLAFLNNQAAISESSSFLPTTGASTERMLQMTECHIIHVQWMCPRMKQSEFLINLESKRRRDGTVNRPIAAQT